MTLSPNMTKETLSAIMDALPEEMTAAEITALTLLVHERFLSTPQEIIANLIAAIYSYGQVNGISKSAISVGLRASALVYMETHDDDRKH
jgi:hypothetical protein